MKKAYVFPGQGSQVRGMGEGLFERHPQLVQQADECLGYSVRELCLSDPRGVLHRTEYTQPALYVVNVLHYLERVGRAEAAPDFVAGHSLGEYCALYAAGAFDFATGLRLVKKRGELMAQAPKGGMAAVVQLDVTQVETTLARLSLPNVQVANLNSRTQCVLSGAFDEINSTELRTAFAAAGGVVIPLNVSAAFHSRRMASVEREFARYLADSELRELQIPVIANCTARPYPRKGYAQYLERQIASPVYWYQSISWLLAQGCDSFEEVGPGKVLTKLCAKIAAEPRATAEPPIAVGSFANGSRERQEPPEPRRAKVIFMYGGQGSQYFQMGRGLYQGNAVFRRSMDRCSALHEKAHGVSLVRSLYSAASKSEPFDDVLCSHPALYAIGFSLTELLRHEGVEPDAVIGYSLGEYVALTASGALRLEDGLALVAQQAEVLKRRCRGGMLSVLAPSGLFQTRRDIFGGVSLAAVNFAENFVVSGEAERLRQVSAKLEAEGMIAIPLAVRYAFHSDLMDAARDEVVASGARVELGKSQIPVYSTTYARALDDTTRARFGAYLWDVLRSPIRFLDLIQREFAEPEGQYFVDLSASGSLTNFLRHGFGARYRSAPAINQFGNNAATLEKLLGELASVFATRQSA